MFSDFDYKYFLIVLFALFPLLIFAQHSDRAINDTLHNIEKNRGSELSFFSEKGINIDSVINVDMFKQVKNWIGTRYRYGGKNKKGIDCSGFVRAVLDSTFSVKFWGGSALMQKNVMAIEKGELKEGDLLFFSNRNKKRVSHVALYLGNNKFAHSASGKGVIISDLNEPWYINHYFSAGRINNLQSYAVSKYGHNEKALLFK